MDNITNVTVKPLDRGGKFVTPIRVDYEQDGKAKFWEAVRVSKSVSCVIFNVSRRKFVCVRQFRPAVYVNGADGIVWSEPDVANIGPEISAKSGVTWEFCGGICDKPGLSLEQICVEEVLEETGYAVKAESLVKIGTSRCHVGVAGEAQTVYYVEVTDDMRRGPGGGIDEEMIDVVELGVDEAKSMLGDDTVVAPTDFFWGLSWFFLNKNQA
ncbi:NUDIX domain [Nesidiocoris tenuis]|uniref:NUDIX domain n=1 Tax=Nesidiocoris tenuis TaxID=355587 RepID=A0ABN7BAS7_9HEMI|nr:NUDIX domain [Nesidiocoris tenuis]